MKKLIIGITLLSLSGMAFANSQARNLSNEAQAKIEEEIQSSEDFRNNLERIVHRASLLTDVKFNCTRGGQEKINQFISGFNGELKEEYKGIFSCEGAIERALNDGITESEIREELGL